MVEARLLEGIARFTQCLQAVVEQRSCGNWLEPVVDSEGALGEHEHLPSVQRTIERKL